MLLSHSSHTHTHPTVHVFASGTSQYVVTIELAVCRRPPIHLSVPCWHSPVCNRVRFHKNEGVDACVQVHKRMRAQEALDRTAYNCKMFSFVWFFFLLFILFLSYFFIFWSISSLLLLWPSCAAVYFFSYIPSWSFFLDVAFFRIGDGDRRWCCYNSPADFLLFFAAHSLFLLLSFLYICVCVCARSEWFLFRRRRQKKCTGCWASDRGNLVKDAARIDRPTRRSAKDTTEIQGDKRRVRKWIERDTQKRKYT